MRFFDIVISLIGLIMGWPLFSLIFIAGLFDTGSPIYLQERVGKNLKPFILFKFRTMSIHATPNATHLIDGSLVTPLGSFLRKTKLDELPQLWNVLKGDMSLVGPRPCLLNQKEVIETRYQLGVFAVRPGITGLAQINDIDMSTPELLAATDAQMISTLTISKYLTFIIKTVFGHGSGDKILP